MPRLTVSVSTQQQKWGWAELKVLITVFRLFSLDLLIWNMYPKSIWACQDNGGLICAIEQARALHEPSSMWVVHVRQG
jgi:hypothetical protein